MVTRSRLGKRVSGSKVSTRRRWPRHAKPRPAKAGIAGVRLQLSSERSPSSGISPAIARASTNTGDPGRLLRGRRQRQRGDGARRVSLGLREIFNGIRRGRGRGEKPEDWRLARCGRGALGLQARRIAGRRKGGAERLRDQRKYLVQRAHLSSAVEPWYDRVNIDEARGERWFCSEAEAQAAGWRPASSN